MKRAQRSVIPTRIHNSMVQGSWLRRLLSGSLLGLSVTFILTLLEIVFIWLFNPFHLPGYSTNFFLAVFALPLHSPLILLVPLLELVVFSSALILVARPLALTSYLRIIHRIQEPYYNIYIPLPIFTSPQANGEVASALPASQSTLLDGIQQQTAHQLLLGAVGSGKTLMLRVYQYIVSQRPFVSAFSHATVPVFIPMKQYCLFLKQQQPILNDDDDLSSDMPSATLLDFLYTSDLPGMRQLRPFLQLLFARGRLLLLCDGLDEVDDNYLPQVTQEIMRLMHNLGNRLVLTCREVDYHEQRDLVQLVNDEVAVCTILSPLSYSQMSESIERYIEKQDKHWQHTAGQILSVIDHTRLRFLCTNPMLLFTLLQSIDKIGVERGKQIDTRGRLLRAYVKQLLENEQRQAQWQQGAPIAQDVIHLLSEVACAACWSDDRYAIQLPLSPSFLALEEHHQEHTEVFAAALLAWLDEHAAQSPFARTSDDILPGSYDTVTELLQFALSASLIEISPSGVLSFCHKMLSEYFVAEYFLAAADNEPLPSLVLQEGLFVQVERWHGPVALWAGLLERPLELAECFGASALRNPIYNLQALTLGLLCVGVVWTPPQANAHRMFLLPDSLQEALVVALRTASTDLAFFFMRCSEEGGQEIYRSLLSVIMIDSVDDFLLLLDQHSVVDVLFTHLQDAVEDTLYEAQVKRLARVLGRFGDNVVERATQLSLPSPERSIRLRAVVINILGGTNEDAAVEPLIARLMDAETFIVERATHALFRLGPTLTLTPVIQALESRSSSPFTPRVHWAALTILGRFLNEQDRQRQVPLATYQRILESIVPVLTASYQDEPEIQQQAHTLLVAQSRSTGADTGDQRREKVVETLARYLAVQNDVTASNIQQALQEIAAPAVPHLLELLKHPSELVRLRAITILLAINDPRALPALLLLVGDPAPAVQQQVARALYEYAPASIAGLLDLVLTDPADVVADRSAHILSTIGEPTVQSILDVLPNIVPGRTRLLVQVLEVIHDPRALFALIGLLQTPYVEPLLAISIVRALCRFPEKRVVTPLITLLSATNPQLYEEAINALSQLGAVSFEGLIAALDVEEDTLVTQRVRRAILGMVPFPSEQLINILETCSEAQAEHIMALFKQQGSDGAILLVQNLLYPTENVQQRIHMALAQMPGSLVVPALLETLFQPALCKISSSFLLNYPDAAIVPLVALLGEQERGAIAAAILPQFGSLILRPLLVGLDDQRSVARELAQRIVITLVRQSPDEQQMITEVLQLFNPAPPIRAREALLSVLTNELAEASRPVLLNGLEDAHLIDDISEALVRLAHKSTLQQPILHDLLDALYREERRRGAEATLIRLGAPAVVGVGELITEQNATVARSARSILCEIGVPALTFIWNAHTDRSNTARRAAATEIFRNMRSEIIKDELIALLVSQKRDNISMAVALLLERIHDESAKAYSEQVLVPSLIEYVLTHTIVQTNLRVMAILLLLSEQMVVDHLLPLLNEHPERGNQLRYILLLMGKNTHESLLDAFNDPDTSPELLADLSAILGMVMAPDVLTDYVYNLGKTGLAAGRTSALFPEQFSIGLRALGGLLASGQWDAQRLQELRDASREDAPGRELFNVLLGMRYEPQLIQLQSELDTQRSDFKKELLTISARVMTEQKRASALEDELEKVRDEHSVRGDELQHMQRETETLRARVAQLTKDSNLLRANLEQVTRDKAALNTTLERTKQDYQILQRRLQQQQQNNPTIK